MNHDRCVVCAWYINGTARDPRPNPPHMGCLGAGAVDRRCAANWLAYDPEDRELLWPTYDDWLMAES